MTHELRRSFWVFILSFQLIPLPAYAGTVQEPAATLSFEQGAEVLHMQCPPDWRRVASEEAFFVFVAPNEDPSDAFQENVNLIVQDLKPPVASLEDFTKKSIEQMTRLMPKMRILDMSSTTLSGLPAQRMVYTN